VVSRARRPIEELVRLGLDERGQLSVKRHAGGRSAWVVPRLDLLRKLQKKPGMVRRSLRRTPVSVDGLVEDVASLLADRVAKSLVRAWRSGTVREPRPTDSPSLVRLVAWHPSDQALVGQMLPWDAVSVGCLLGRARIHTFVVRMSRPSRALLHDLRLWLELGYSPAPLAAPLP
jgi:predicted RNA-binding protein YlxR (DUF448 family)